MITEWTVITESDRIPPMGDALAAHLSAYKGGTRHASCSAWNLLYRTLQNSKLPIAAVAFTETGKPYFPGIPLYFSLSHSKGLCAVAIADVPVGVDIELCRDNLNPRLIDKSLCDAEKEVYDGDFIRFWCRKEAVAKMTGAGISGYPSHIDTTKYAFREHRIDHAGREYWLAAVGLHPSREDL